ncbi:hypothetical protein ACIBO2_00015 [Nonomuraea sp. NPDC050022]
MTITTAKNVAASKERDGHGGPKREDRTTITAAKSVTVTADQNVAIA